MADELVWTYCVARAGERLPTGQAGVAGTVERVAAGELAALVSRVPAAEFAAEPLRANLNQLPWLERVARAHEAVLERALDAATIVPLRLCTLYEDEDGVRAMLEREREALTHALDGLTGRQEWGVKLLVDRQALERAAREGSEDAARLEDEAAARTGGGAYLLRRRLERHLREEAHALAEDLARDVHAALRELALGAVTRPPQNRELSGHEGEMLLNAAYLVDAERVGQLRACVDELQRRHVAFGARLELTGPWPPYNFVPGEGIA